MGVADMRAPETLEMAQAAGVMVTVEGNELLLWPPAPPPISVLDALSCNKAEIVR